MKPNLRADGARSFASDADLRAISRLAERALDLEKEIETIETQLRVKADELRQLSTDLLPQAMLAVNLRKFEMADGSSVSVKDVIRAAIPKPKTEEALDWLRAGGYGDLIKHVLSVSLDRGRDNVAAEIVSYLRDKFDLDPENRESVHPQTLGAFCRDMLERGADLPAELLGLYVGKEAVIKPKKER